MSGYIGVDLDGTLAHYEPGQWPAIGAPVPRMLERVKAWLAEGQEVRIITARVAPCYPDAGDEWERIHQWLLRHLGQELPIQAHKCGDMLRLYDDRAVQVEANTGRTTEGVLDYDERFGIESDPVARFQDYASDYVVRVDFCEGHEFGDRYLCIREARVLAARLLKMADAAEAAGRRTT